MKFWKGPKHLNILLAMACIIVGLVGLVLEFFFRDRTGMLISLIILVGGGALYGFQALAWKQYEERKKNNTNT